MDFDKGDIPEVAKALISQMLQNSKNVFVMEWKGSKVPRKGRISDKEIGWTQHGMITSTNSEHLGTYERLIEFGGANQDEHVMVIGTSYDTAKNPDGTDCRNMTANRAAILGAAGHRVEGPKPRP